MQTVADYDVTQFSVSSVDTLSYVSYVKSFGFKFRIT